ncbi:hypothetical protein [Treponema berlinense]|uniref:hypothetical protein n=1 Tax=Treponema berlinense TaxID=225004 RepID=UPI0026F00F22|nr:hypothetical protein [Treponema berlinense]
MKKIIRIFTLLLALFLISCTSSNVEVSEEQNAEVVGQATKKIKPLKYNQAEYQKAFEQRDYSTCLRMLLYKTKKKANIRDNLDLAMLYFLNGNYAQASVVFEKTDALMFDALTKSVTKSVGKAVVNENIKEYTGNVYEFLLVNTMNSLCYYLQGDLNNAVNQLTRLSDLKLPEYRRLYGEVLVTEGLDPSVKEDLTDGMNSLKSYNIDSSVFTAELPQKPSEKDLYKESAMARYLSLVLRQADGDKSQVDSDSMVLKSLMKEFDEGDVKIPSDFGRLDVIALGGLIGKQTERELYFPSKSTFFYIPTGVSSFRVLPVQFKFVHPAYKKTSTVKGIDVVLNGVGTKKTVIVENFNTNLEKSVKLKARKEYAASMRRSITKKVSGIVAGIAGINAANEGLKRISSNSLAHTLGAVGFSALCESTIAGLSAIDLTETADIRQGEFFPETVNAAGFTIPAGLYRGKVIYRFFDGSAVEKEFEAEVKEGKPSLVVSSCIK